jgi:hypothetical protein
MFTGLRCTRSTRIASDAFDATKVTLKAIQASTDAFAPLKSVVSAVLVILDGIEVGSRLQHVFQVACSRTTVSTFQKVRSNKKGCAHIAERSAKLVQDIWRQTKDFNVALPAEVEKSVIQIEKYVPALSTHSFEYLPGLQAIQRD